MFFSWELHISNLSQLCTYLSVNAVLLYTTLAWAVQHQPQCQPRQHLLENYVQRLEVQCASTPWGHRCFHIHHRSENVSLGRTAIAQVIMQQAPVRHRRGLPLRISRNCIGTPKFPFHILNMFTSLCVSVFSVLRSVDDFVTWWCHS